MKRGGLIFLLLGLLYGGVFALDIEEPELLWRQVLGGAALTNPSVQSGSIVVVCDGGTLKALSESGNFLWEYKSGGKLLPFLTRSSTGTSYICRTNGVFHAVNRSGRRLWRVNLREEISAPPLIGWDDRVFVFLSKKFLCFTASGTQLWRFETESPLAYPPVPDKDGGFAGVLENGTFIRVSPFGQLKALPPAAAPFAVFPMAAEARQSDAGIAPALALYADGRLDSLDFIEGNDGEYTLRETRLLRLPAPPVAAAERGGLVAALLSTGELTLISPEKGVLWTVKIEVLRSGGVEIYWKDGIYLLSHTGGEGYDLEGRRLWNMSLSGAAAIPVLDERGVMYSCGKDWVLYAYRVEEKAPPSSDETVYNMKAPGEYGLGKAPAEAAPGTNGDGAFPAFLLETIENSVKTGNLREKEPEYTRLLLSIAGGVNPRPQSIELRLKALGILALLGSSETIPFLAGLFHRDTNIMIKTAAAEAIGAIGVDPEGLVFDAFAEAIAPSRSYLQDRLLYSIAVSIGKLYKFSGPSLSRRGIELLINLSSYTQTKRVRRRALQELAEIQGLM